MKTGPYNYLVEHGVDVGSKLMETVLREKGHLIYQPPQRITPIFEIISGAVKIGSYSPQGMEVCYDILKPGDFFGNLQYLKGQFSEFAKTLSPVELRAYDPVFFKELVTNQPKLSEWFSKELVIRWCRAEDRLYSIRSLDATGKVRRILPCFQYAIEDASGKTFNLLNLITFQDIADLTGLSRQTVSKVMKEFLTPTKTKKKELTKTLANDQ
ncbi:Crp/Fnr family transcriptional regulator [Cognataquiflexum rubidum]|uniref:Crp/Fnr family transcriptional regulator n=1 Tax=Cognataquiflexum rubidum TaxID=2922273 RepID=UPI001F12CBC1|nr:Crp/Fnr family transcriptional regulator [Cognataquiflexum rubidum]MCH6236010.1 Crp/Fnr family transcriptional regulator [Cognataquiflexum rubidum]